MTNFFTDKQIQDISYKCNEIIHSSENIQV